MAAIRTVEDLIGSYDYEEAKEQEILMLKLENKELKQRNIETVKKMLNDGLKVDLISKYTGLSIEQIEQLKEDIQV